MSTPERAPLGVIGVGWVGLVSAVCFAELGHDVWCVDVDREKLETLARGEVQLHEPGIAEAVARNAQRLHFSADLGALFDAARIAFVCVDTPPTRSGDADLSRVQSVLDALPASAAGALLVMKSTVPVGTGRKLRYELDQRGRGSIAYASNPEFLREGSALADFMVPDRVIVGSEDEESAEQLRALYEPISDRVVCTDIASAELIKLASNAFLATKISFINEIANLCEEVGADVDEVALGMGLDSRIGASFLRPGIGYGGSCLMGEATVLARRGGSTRLLRLESLWDELAAESGALERVAGALEPACLEVLAWRGSRPVPEYLPVKAVSRRPYEGDVVDVVTKMGRRLTTTADHPFVVGDGVRGEVGVKLAAELDGGDWLPLGIGAPAAPPSAACSFDVVEAVEHAGITAREIIVRPLPEEIRVIAEQDVMLRATALDHPRGSRVRIVDMLRAGALRLHEARVLDVSLTGATIGTARNGTYVPSAIAADERFWRVVGLYLAEGHCTVDGQRHRLQWTFHPTREEHLVEEVAGYWGSLGVKAVVRTTATARIVTVSSRVLATWWLRTLRLGRGSYDHRLPDAIWDRPPAEQEALLSGLWAGDGSWSLIAGGPSVALEYGTVSVDLADGMLRLLGGLGIVARWKLRRLSSSTRDTSWLTISGAGQIERALWLLPLREAAQVRDLLGRQRKRIAPTGYRRSDRDGTWVRVSSAQLRPFAGPVYSLEVPEAETVVATAGLVTHNCFPKDVTALKQLAGNTGYHFQLLASVIEVNELQKRRVINKLKRHLGSLRGRKVALWGLAFKPDTNDMREASSIVLAHRLAAEGVCVTAYDPVVKAAQIRHLMPDVELCAGALEAAEGADAVVIVTEWPQFRGLVDAELRERMAGSLVVDGRNLLDAEAVRAAGLEYEGVGRGRGDVPAAR